jgi:hypothetical protein
MRRRAVDHFHEIADGRPFARIDAALEKAAVGLRTEQRFTVVQLVAGPVLRHYAGKPQTRTGQRVTTPAYATQAFDRFGITHGGDLAARVR